MNGWWLVCVREVLIPWVLIMLWLKVKSNTERIHLYTAAFLLIGASWEKCSFCWGCMSKMNVSCAEQIIKAIWEQFCQSKETNSTKYQIILSLQNFSTTIHLIYMWSHSCLETQRYLTSVKGIKLVKKVQCNAVSHCVYNDHLTYWL